MKYQVGDTVIVRSDIKTRRPYFMEDGKEHAIYTDYMKNEFGGKEVTIASTSISHYKIEEDGRVFFWTDGMFEDVLLDDEILISEDPLLLYGWS